MTDIFENDTFLDKYTISIFKGEIKMSKKPYLRLIKNSDQTSRMYLSECAGEKRKEDCSEERNRRFEQAISYDFEPTKHEVRKMTESNKDYDQENSVQEETKTNKPNEFLSIALFVITMLIITLSIYVDLKEFFGQ